ncbi:hypothetical protein NPX13_g2516 [Xylaria arbuscula]|uniref:Uncharacterized protein n=1 Tax=Xylaria arbuscula TaxID=114810 RepID=A0A9W8TNN8_9PEZI|nr:hypothetical protein NPX13_g2516 [Xylaria arbuscula]
MAECNVSKSSLDQAVQDRTLSVTAAILVFAITVALMLLMVIIYWVELRHKKPTRNKDIELAEQGLPRGTTSRRNSVLSGHSVSQSEQPPRGNPLRPMRKDSFDLEEIDIGSPVISPRTPIRRKPLPNPPSMSSLSTAREAEVHSRSGSPHPVPSIPESRSLTEAAPHEDSVFSVGDEDEDIYGASEVSSPSSATDHAPLEPATRDQDAADQDTSSDGHSAPPVELPAPLSPIPEGRENSPDPKQ